MADVSDDVDIQVEAGSDTVTITLRGELDVANADSLDEAVTPLIERGANSLVLDVSELRFADSSAIALWVRWSTRVDHIELRRPSPLLRKVIASMGLSERLRLVS